MLCDNCKKNNASVHITKFVNGLKQETNLCDNCAHELNGLNLAEVSNMGFGNTFTVQDLLGGIIDYVNQSSKNNINHVATCKKCGMTYIEFRKTGLMGCSECYDSFKTSLIPLIKRVQGNIEHVGKIPKKTGKEIIERKQILSLKEKLNRAILAEEYEKAAMIRDQIRELQSVSKEM
jgi:protein arginine kinase activator